METFLLFVQATEKALHDLRDLKTAGWDARALSIAITHLETAQLWATNAKPEDV